eukprot:COSAG02_NODE_1488_length_12368_cov_23.731926_3_plen_1446_part_00
MRGMAEPEPEPEPQAAGVEYVPAHVQDAVPAVKADEVAASRMASAGALPDSTLHADIDELNGNLKWKRADASLAVLRYINTRAATKAAGWNPLRWSDKLSPPALSDAVDSDEEELGASAIQVKGDTFDTIREFASQLELRSFLACFEEASDSTWVRSSTLDRTQSVRPHAMDCECKACMTVQVTRGQKIEIYRKIEKINSGTFGGVWKARHQRSSQFVAIKQINLARYSTPLQWDALNREVRILRKLSTAGCRNVVQLLDVGLCSAAEVLPACDAPLPKYLIMECCTSDLAQFIADPLFPAEGLAERRVKTLMADLARGLRECRQNGIVHHDLKPANLLLVGEPVAVKGGIFPERLHTTSPIVLKIGDFGSCCASDEPARPLTAVGGTDHYMAPECQYDDRDSQAATIGSSDLWSVGVIGFELLTRSSVPYRKGELREHYDAKSSHSLNELARRINGARGAGEKMDKSGGAMNLLHGLLSPYPTVRLSSKEFFSHPWIDVAVEPCGGARSIVTDGGWLTRVDGVRKRRLFCQLAKSNSVDDNKRPVYELKCGTNQPAEMKVIELRIGAYSCKIDESNKLQIQLTCTYKSYKRYPFNADTEEEAESWVRALQPSNLEFVVCTTWETESERALHGHALHEAVPPTGAAVHAAAQPEAQLDEKPLRILCIDGGGIKGLIPSLILEKIEQLCSPKRVHELFDLVCGTSTGGILALGTCLAKTPPTHMSSVYENRAKTIWKARPFGRIANPSAPYDHSGLEGILKEFSTVADGQQMHMADTAYHKPRVFVVASCRNDTFRRFDPFLFRSYTMDPSKGLPGSSGCEVWEAARATSAAPFFFDPISIAGREYFDGGVVANNPVEKAINEAGDIWPNRPISTIVSLGCGMRFGSDSIGDGGEDDNSGKGGVFATLQGVRHGVTDTQTPHEQLLRDFHIAHADRSDSNPHSEQRNNLWYGGKVVQTERGRLKDCFYLRLNPPIDRKVKMQSSESEDLQLLRRNTAAFLAENETLRRMDEMRELLLDGEDITSGLIDNDESDISNIPFLVVDPGGSSCWEYRLTPEPEQPEPEQPEPEQPEPEQPEPEQPQQPEPEQPEQEPEQPEPEQPEPEQPEQEQPEPEQPEPEQPQPEQPEPEQPEPEQPQPEQPEPELTQPEQPEPELTQPEQPEPEQPELTQPEPEQPEPESSPVRQRQCPSAQDISVPVQTASKSLTREQRAARVGLTYGLRLVAPTGLNYGLGLVAPTERVSLTAAPSVTPVLRPPGSSVGRHGGIPMVSTPSGVEKRLVKGLEPEPEQPEPEPESSPVRQRQCPSAQDISVAVQTASKSLTREQRAARAQNNARGIKTEWDLVIDSAGRLKAQLRTESPALNYGLGLVAPTGRVSLTAAPSVTPVLRPPGSSVGRHGGIPMVPTPSGVEKRLVKELELEPEPEPEQPQPQPEPENGVPDRSPAAV